MNVTGTFRSLNDALNFVGLTSGLFINETLVFKTVSNRPTISNSIPLILGLIGLIFNILALLIFTASKTFRQSSFRCYIYAFVLVNCASILTHSWLYLVFYLINPIHVCKYIQYLQQSLSTTSLWIMVLLSIERSLAFTRSFTVKRFLKSRTICLIIFVLILVCFALHVDELISVDVKAFRWVNFAYGICSMKRHSRLATDRIKIITHSHSFLLPFLLNSLLDIYICYQICQRRKRFRNPSNSSIHLRKSRRSKISLANEITLTLLCQSLWLLMTYFPTHLYYSLISFQFIKDHDRDNSTLVFFIRQNLLIYLAFSPTLFVILSPTLRKEIHRHLCRSYKRRKTITSLYLTDANRRLGKFLSDHQGPMLRTRSEQLPDNFFSQQTNNPEIYLLINQKSKSTSCLSTCSEQKDGSDAYRKTDRSSTLQE